MKISIREKYNIIHFITSGFYIYKIIAHYHNPNNMKIIKSIHIIKNLLLLIIIKFIKYTSEKDMQNYIHILSLFEILNLSIVLLNYIIMNIRIEEYDDQRNMFRRMYVVKIINATFSTFLNMYHIPLYVIKMNNIAFGLLFIIIAINNLNCVRLWMSAFYLMRLF